jgi:membrane-anchored glycerophosphoryl diester phosphodiesterase (GDPDase)
MKRRRIEWTVLVLGSWVILGVTFSASTFLYKVIEIIRTVPEGEVAGFAVIQVATYLLVALGFFCLFLWSFLKGDFREMEKAKYQLLEREEAIEREERLWRNEPWKKR